MSVSPRPVPGQGTEYRPPIHLAFISKGPAGGPSHLFVVEYQTLMLRVFFFFYKGKRKVFSFSVLKYWCPIYIADTFSQLEDCFLERLSLEFNLAIVER